LSLVKPIRSKGESSYDWFSRRDSYRIAVIEQQITELQIAVKRLEKKR